jgi:carbonic anhydrase/acetyltransferase-like protein (isoleucine patch superfamily)
MNMNFEFEGKRPVIGKGVFVAPTAVIIGDVHIGDGSSIWYGAVLRADENQIVIGSNTSVQDNAVLHTNTESATRIGNNVTIGHGALIEGCNIEDGAVIGMGAVVLEHSTVGSCAMIAAGSVVARAAIIPAKTLAAGSPAVVKKELSGEALRAIEVSAPVYRKLTESYLAQGLDKISSAKESDSD